jgi:tRNA nucleotidyltransferase (CCA-adding enzyme)
MNYTKALNNKIFQVISQASEELNVDSYVIGGFVRDLILKETSKDIDIVAVGSGIELALKVSALPLKNQSSDFQNYGTAMLRFEDTEIELLVPEKNPHLTAEIRL